MSKNDALSLPIPPRTTIVIFGASGDLTQRKLIPALYTLEAEGRLPERYAVIGVARSAFDDEGFRSHLLEGVRAHARLAKTDDAVWRRFASRLSYCQGDYDDPATYSALAERMAVTDDLCSTCGNHLFYLSTPPQLYPVIIAHLGAAGLNRKGASGGGSEGAGPSVGKTAERAVEGDFVRIIIEKPFGDDLAGAQALNEQVHEVFDESQVYRIDHYLGKETVQNIMVFRFANAIFEPVWNRNYVDHVQITVAEEVGVGQRAGYYDSSGVLRDVFQNHLLQLMTLIAMEPPAAFNAKFLRDEKVKVLQAVRPMRADEVLGATVRGQYRTYRDEKGVRPGSTTATYAAVRLHIDNWRWQGVPFYLRSGKLLASKATEITVQFKDVPHKLFRRTATASPHANFISFCIQPEEGMHLRFETKTPGAGMRMRSVEMDFQFGEEFGSAALPEAYERLLLDALNGDASLFARSDEIELSWQITDPIQAGWDTTNRIDSTTDAPSLEFYERGTWGPPAADRMLTQVGRHWRVSCI